MKSLKDFINESSETVFAVQDNTGAILSVFPTKQEAQDNLKEWPKVSGAKIVTMKRSEIEA